MRFCLDDENNIDKFCIIVFGIETKRSNCLFNTVMNSATEYTITFFSSKQFMEGWS